MNSQHPSLIDFAKTAEIDVFPACAATAKCDFDGAVAASQPQEAPAVVVVPFEGRAGFFIYADSQVRR